MTTDPRRVAKTTVFDKPLQQPEDTDVKFGSMSGLQKSVYVTKVAICIATFGYAFPHV
jgi:hypothetical protein